MNLSPQGCNGWYGNNNNNQRIAAYWARHYEIQAASTQTDGTPWDFSDFQINSNYQPNTAGATVGVTTGFSWSLTGTGTVGPSSSAIGFQTGASWNNSTTQNYTAMAATSNVASSASDNPSLAQWDYDAYNFVRSSLITPKEDEACGGSNFDLKSIQGTDVTSTFSPQVTYLWQATSAVRTALNTAQNVAAGGSPTLPLNINLGVLMGWAYWLSWSHPQCKNPGNTDEYYLGWDANHAYAWINSAGNGLTSLVFDVSCATTSYWGTVPLGPSDKDQQDPSEGNPGPLYMLNSGSLYVPFAPLQASSP